MSCIMPNWICTSTCTFEIQDLDLCMHLAFSTAREEGFQSGVHHTSSLPQFLTRQDVPRATLYLLPCFTLWCFTFPQDIFARHPDLFGRHHHSTSLKRTYFCFAVIIHAQYISMPATVSWLQQKPSLPGLDGLTPSLERVNAARETLNTVCSQRSNLMRMVTCLERHAFRSYRSSGTRPSDPFPLVQRV